MKPDLFVTGPAGFVGKHLLRHIEPDAYGEIHLLARRPLLVPTPLAGRARTLRGDLLQPATYRQVLTERTRVIHLAAATGNASSEEHRAVNVDGTAALLQVCAEVGVQRFVFVSTIAVTFADISDYPYALTKLEAEALVRDSGLPFTIVRPTIVLGPTSPIWTRLRSLASGPVLLVPGAGTARIQPVWVDDLALALLRIAGEPGREGQTLELGGPEQLTVQDFLGRARQAAGKRGGRAVHIPLGPVRAPLRIIEKRMPIRLPVSSGQFSSFVHDGVARSSESLWTADHAPIDVAGMLERLA